MTIFLLVISVIISSLFFTLLIFKVLVDRNVARNLVEKRNDVSQKELHTKIETPNQGVLPTVLKIALLLSLIVAVVAAFAGNQYRIADNNSNIHQPQSHQITLSVSHNSLHPFSN